MNSILFLILILISFCSTLDPYGTLGISSRASPEEIKKAYKKMVLKWHPDKNKDNEEVAAEKFMEIQSAYEILTDETKKRNYDSFGNPDGPFGSANGRGYSGHGDFNHEDFFRAFYQQRQQQRYQPIPSKTPSLSINDWYSTVMSDDNRDVYLVQFYAPGLGASYAFANTWEAIASKLNSFVQTARVNHNEYESLAARVGVKTIPALVAVVDQEVFIYDGPRNLYKIISWTQSLIPNVVTRLNSVAQKNQFEMQNFDKTLIYLFSKKSIPAFSYKWAAYRYRDDIVCAIVESDTDVERVLRKEFGVRRTPAVIARREPTKIISLPTSGSQLRKELKSVRFQRLPLLNKHNFDSICEDQRTCVVYCYWNANEHDYERSWLSWWSSEWRDRVALSYSNAASKLARALTELRVLAARQSRLKHAARLSWLSCDAQPALCRHLECSVEQPLVAWQRVSPSKYLYVNSELMHLSQLWAGLTVRKGELRAAAERAKLSVSERSSAPPHPVERVTWRKMLRRRTRQVAYYIDHFVGLNTLFTLLVISYSLYSACCRGAPRRADTPENTPLALELESRALIQNQLSRSIQKQLMENTRQARLNPNSPAARRPRIDSQMPSDNIWLIKARAHRGGVNYDSFGELSQVISKLPSMKHYTALCHWRPLGSAPLVHSLLQNQQRLPVAIVNALV